MRRAVGQFRRWSPDLVRALSLAVSFARPPTGPRQTPQVLNSGGATLVFWFVYTSLSRARLSALSKRRACGRVRQVYSPGLVCELPARVCEPMSHV